MRSLTEDTDSNPSVFLPKFLKQIRICQFFWFQRLKQVCAFVCVCPSVRATHEYGRSECVYVKWTAVIRCGNPWKETSRKEEKQQRVFTYVLRNVGIDFRGLCIYTDIHFILGSLPGKVASFGRFCLERVHVSLRQVYFSSSHLTLKSGFSLILRAWASSE